MRILKKGERTTLEIILINLKIYGFLSLICPVIIFSSELLHSYTLGKVSWFVNIPFKKVGAIVGQ